VRRICGGLAPYLKELELAELIAETRVANRRFSNDQCAMVLEISAMDCLAQAFRFLGCDNDPEYLARHKARRERNAACQRKRRAACSTGRPYGRPALSAFGRREDSASQGARCRACETPPSVTQNPVTGQDKNNR
jgi:hypothetical protein